MAVLVQIPLALQKFTKHQSTVQIEGVTVQEASTTWYGIFPEIRAQLCDSRGAIRKFINLASIMRISAFWREKTRPSRTAMH